MVNLAQGIQPGVSLLAKLQVSVVRLTIINPGKLEKLTARGTCCEEEAPSSRKTVLNSEFLLLLIMGLQAQYERMDTCVELFEEYWKSFIVHISTVQ